MTNQYPKSNLSVVVSKGAVLLLGVLASNALAATKYSVEVQNVQQQTDNSTIVSGYSTLGYNQYSLVAKIDTGGASLAAGPILGLPALTASFPSGTIAFPT
ncbi:MAG: hypothetical protein WCI73_14325, partial [Phycisphaerae bacterium]